MWQEEAASVVWFNQAQNGGATDVERILYGVLVHLQLDDNLYSNCMEWAGISLELLVCPGLTF